MPYSDYKCENCKTIFEYYKKSVIESFPKVIECPNCKCGAKRIYSGKLNFDVAEGIQGNSKNSYSKGITYHPGSLVGKMKGTKIK